MLTENPASAALLRRTPMLFPTAQDCVCLCSTHRDASNTNWKPLTQCHGIPGHSICTRKDRFLDRHMLHVCRGSIRWDASNTNPQADCSTNDFSFRSGHTRIRRVLLPRKEHVSPCSTRLDAWSTSPPKVFLHPVPIARNTCSIRSFHFSSWFVLGCWLFRGRQDNSVSPDMVHCALTDSRQLPSSTLRTWQPTDDGWSRQESWPCRNCR